MILLLALGFMARVRLRDGLEALSQPFTCRMLLRIGEQLISLSSNFAPLIICQLITHLLDENQKCPPRSLSIPTPLRDSSGTFNDWFGFLTKSQTTKDETLCGEGLREEGVFAT